MGQTHSNSNLAKAIEAVASTASSHPAVVCGELSLSYQELIERSVRLCGTLQEFGVQPIDRVGILLPNGCAFPIAALAVWRAGAVVTPFHPGSNQSELDKYVHDCGIEVLLTDSSFKSRIHADQASRFGLREVLACEAGLGGWSRLMPAGAKRAATRPNAAVPARDGSALTQFSTGSTGRSKRVTRLHQDLLGEFASVSSVLGIGSKDRILGAAPYCHSFGFINGMLFGLLAGATIYPVAEYFTRDIARLIEREKITGLPGIPFYYQLLYELNGSFDLSSLRYALSAGAPLSEETGKGFRERFGVAVRQLYGSTESGVLSIAPKEPGKGSSVGLPIPGVTVQIEDADGRTVPSGETGNVAVTSGFAITSYDNSSDQVGAHFRDRKFYPGDLGRIDSNGELTLCGRKRDFINVGGNKVDPGEVELILLGHPSILEAAVVGVPGGAAGERIKAVIVASIACSAEDIYSYCRQHLADFKCPRAIEFRKELPKSPLGKILRKSLIDDA